MDKQFLINSIAIAALISSIWLGYDLHKLKEEFKKLQKSLKK